AASTCTTAVAHLSKGTRPADQQRQPIRTCKSASYPERSPDLRWLRSNGKGFVRCGARLPVNLSHLANSWATASRAAEGDARASGEFRAVLVEELGHRARGATGDLAEGASGVVVLA